MVFMFTIENWVWFMLLSGKLTFDLVPFACFVLGTLFVFPISYMVEPEDRNIMRRMRIIQCSSDGICLDRLSVLNILFDT